MNSENPDISKVEFKILPYNTGNSKLPLPEYGRNIQRMVDYCVGIEDRDERTACAYSIIEVMRTLFPKAIADKNDDTKFWDHLNIMAKFQLDIDFPCEVIDKEHLNPKPDKVPYKTSHFAFRHYGRNIENMIARISDMEGSDEKDELIFMVANQMKKLLLVNNKEGVSDARVIRDMNFLSGGKLAIDPEQYQLCEFKEHVTDSNQGKKKKKK